MRLVKVFLTGYLSVNSVEFEAAPFTVLFGKNNAGKSNILEALYGLFTLQDTRVTRTRDVMPGFGRELPAGAVHVELERGTPFDDAMWAAADGSTTAARSPRRVAFTGRDLRSVMGLPWFEGQIALLPEDAVRGVPTVEGSDLHVLFLDWGFKDLHKRVEAAIASHVAELRGDSDWPWLERIDSAEECGAWRLPPELLNSVKQLSSLATDLLPDFVEGRVRAFVNDPSFWGEFTKVGLHSSLGGEVDLEGQGAARWIAAAVQLALHLMAEFPDLITLRDHAPGGFSGHMLLVDEPEAHLHPSAAASVVRWCRRMVDHGFTVMVASHHEEFLRAAGDDVALVHVVFVASDRHHTRARTLPTATTSRLLELASDVGMHPASALSLHRAILFVEGTLDEAVLDEYGGLELDAAGVKIIPIYGTKNLEGLIAVELVTQLGIKLGILTDATDPATMLQKSGNKRSSEERKVIKVITIAKEKGLPVPTAFGVPEEDLLFALPADAIRTYLKGPFPGWKELVAECRQALGKGPSDSVDWKLYASEHYGLPITTPAEVRKLVRELDLANVPLPSIRRVIDEVVNWAK